MTVIEKQPFTCHTCGTHYAYDVLVSTNSFMPTPVLRSPACPRCGTAARYRIEFSPGSLFEILFELADNQDIPQAAIDRLIGWCTSIADIEQWRAGFAKTRWERIIRGNLKHVNKSIQRTLAALASAEPFGDFNSVHHDAQALDHPSEAARRFASISQPRFESWQQMNRDLRAMMDADPQIGRDAAQVVEEKWGAHAASYRRLDEALKRDLRAKVEAYFEAVRQQFAADVLAARRRSCL